VKEKVRRVAEEVRQKVDKMEEVYRYMLIKGVGGKKVERRV
jgi:hypothetical protein